MMRRVAITVACGALLVGAFGCASAPPKQELTAEQIKDLTLTVKSATGTEEADLVGKVERNREEYRKSLADLVAYYNRRGSAASMNRVQLEMRDLAAVRQATTLYWEDRLPVQPSAKTASPEADALLKDGDKLMGVPNPFTRGDRYVAAAAKYQDIVLKYPNSTAVSDACFRLGEIYSSTSVAEYGRAAHFYELSYLAYPSAMGKSLLRAAEVYDVDLADYAKAAECYRMAAQFGGSDDIKNKAAKRLQALQEKGFGSPGPKVNAGGSASPK